MNDAEELRNKGEVRLANVPNALVEVAFHDNPDDATKLKDPAFRTAAMKGVEKGWRLFRAGKPCAPFELTHVDSGFSGPANTDILANARFTGNPTLPITMKIENIVCPTYPLNYYCAPVYYPKLTNVTDTSLTFTVSCAHSAGVPRVSYVDRATLLDADGIATSAIDFSWSCGGT